MAFGNNADDVDERQAGPSVGGRLFRKYAAMFVAVVSAALAVNSGFEIWFSYREQKALLVRIQREQAQAAAASIRQYVQEIEGQMAWARMVSWDADTFDDWRLNAVRLLRQVPAVSELAQLDGAGRELFRVSRQAIDVVGSLVDRSRDLAFTQAIEHTVYYGPVHFVGGSEPYMTIAMAGYRPEYGVIEAQVNLKFIWDVVSQTKVDGVGYAYVVDANRRLIAHPDISLVLRNTDLSDLPQVAAARAARQSDEKGILTAGEHGWVLSANSALEPLHWLVFVDLPARQAFAPVFNSALRSATLLAAALVVALLAGLILARRMVVPIRALHDGATRVGRGDLGHRIAIATGDELEVLGDQFNSMAARLQESHATLERKVDERTRQLEIANLAKSRFLAAASHDLRQPLHAIGLFVGQLRGRMHARERMRLVERIEAALSAMNELFSALLDVSRLDAGAMTPSIADFPVAHLLGRAETTFAEAAREKGLSLRVVRCGAWVRSDFILLERVVFNLISNAVRYTNRGGIVIGCRNRGDELSIEVCDTGVGVPPDQLERIFGEFYRLGEPDRDRRAGLGLGLAIVDRLCRLLDHPVRVRSNEGRGSVFAVTVPKAPARARTERLSRPERLALNLAEGKFVLVIDDDPLVLEGMGGILRSWGCQVTTASTEKEARNAVSGRGGPPDLIISDYYVSDRTTGLEIIAGLRRACSAEIPAFLISGDTNPECVREARTNGCSLLHKPVDPMALRAMFNQTVCVAERSEAVAAQ